MTENALTKKINIPAWFVIASYGWLLYEALKKPKSTGISKSDYAALNRERVRAKTDATQFEKKLYGQGLIEEDDLFYYDLPAQ